MDRIDLIPLDNIDASFGNDRTVFDGAALADLADSIRENGLAQPVTVRVKSAGIYQLVAGERRTRATRLLFEQAELVRAFSVWFGLPLEPNPFVSIRAIVVQLDDDAAAAIMLAENTGRKDLDPIDEAAAYQRRMADFGWDAKTVAARAGVSAQIVNNRLKLLALRADIQHLVRTGNLQIGYAQILAESELDNNRQLIALRRLQECPSPSPAWLRKECAQLAEQQASNDMFDNALFAAADFAGTVKKQAFTQQLPPDPRKDKAPVMGKTYREVIEGQIKFWFDAADKWDRYGKSGQRDRCLAAMSSLQAIVAMMPPHSGKHRKVKQGKDTLYVYAIAN